MGEGEARSATFVWQQFQFLERLTFGIKIVAEDFAYTNQPSQHEPKALHLWHTRLAAHTDVIEPLDGQGALFCFCHEVCFFPSHKNEWILLQWRPRSNRTFKIFKSWKLGPITNVCAHVCIPFVGDELVISVINDLSFPERLNGVIVLNVGSHGSTDISTLNIIPLDITPTRGLRHAVPIDRYPNLSTHNPIVHRTRTVVMSRRFWRSLKAFEFHSRR